MNSMKSFFKNKKVLIIVPHEDDELNLVGGLFVSNYFDGENTYIAYMTNGDYNCQVKTRLDEAKKVICSCGIKINNIIFLGYCDQHFSEDKHIYMTSNDELFVSKKGKSSTYLTAKQNEFVWQKRGLHSKFNKQSVIEDLELLIFDLKPDIIFVNDFDSHPDHRCLSLCFDNAIGNILRKVDNYCPTIFKGFCYPTSYTGIEDFDNINLLSTKFKTEKFNNFEYQNPYYIWNDRVRFVVGNSDCNYLLLKNKLYQLLKKHSSQLILRKYKSIINSDHVFWQKETNNLCLKSIIKVSSGEAFYLNDCITFDCDDIMHKDVDFPKYKNVSWIPAEDDNEKFIRIDFDSSYLIDNIKLYQNSLSNGKVKDIVLELSNGKKMSYKLNGKMCEDIKVDSSELIKWIKITVVSREQIDSGFSEIEVFPISKSEIKFIKILVDDNFSYNVNSSNYFLGIYCYDGKRSLLLDNNSYLYYVNGNKVNYGDLQYYKENRLDYELKVCLKDNPKIFDEVKIHYIKKFDLVNFKLKMFINKITFIIDESITRVNNKIRKILRRM